MGEHSGPLLPLLVRIFPREFRERVVEPAYNDLLAEELAVEHDRKHLPTPYRTWSRVGLVLSCFRVGLPRFFWNAGRPTVLTNLITLALVFLGVFVVVVAQTASYPPLIQ